MIKELYLLIVISLCSPLYPQGEGNVGMATIEKVGIYQTSIMV